MSLDIIQTRKRLEAKIDELIDMLDLLDDDCDLEDNGDNEPSIGGSPQRGEYDLEFDTSDDELSLGWPNPFGLRVHIPKEAAQLMNGEDFE